MKPQTFRRQCLKLLGTSSAILAPFNSSIRIRKILCYIRLTVHHVRHSWLCLVLLALLVLLMYSWHRVSSTKSRFKSFRFDPEPQLLPGEAEEVKDAHPLPINAAAEKAAGSLTVIKLVHFMYKGYTMDMLLKPILSSWRRVYPDYKLYFWTDKEINELVRRRYPEWQDMYHNQLSNYLERSDVARAFILNAMGGWYSDVDAGCLRRADGVAAAHALVLPLEPYIHAIEHFNKRRLVSNAIMYSVANHPFWVYYLRRLKMSLVGKAARNSTLDAVRTTGPLMLTEVALRFIQAHTDSGCPGQWCPHLAQPVDFMPTYDDHTPYMRDQLQLFCRFTISHPELTKDCKRYQQHDYRNHVNSTQSYAFHAFMHLNERRGDLVRSEGDVRDWRLGLTVGSDILADL